MFTLQNSQLDRLLRESSDTRLVETLRQMLGNCQQPLEHRGPLTLVLDPDTSRPAPCQDTLDPEAPYYSTFTSINWTGRVRSDDLADTSPYEPDVDMRTCGGWAGYFIGPVNITPNPTARENGDNLVLIVNGDQIVHNLFVNALYVNIFYDWDGNVIDFGQRWIQFTLNEDLSGGSAMATVDDAWNGPSPGSPIRVHDRHDLFRGARGPSVGASRAGAKGIAHLDTTNDDWVITEMQSLAGWIWVQLLEDMASEDEEDEDAEWSASATRQGYAGTQQDVQPCDTTIDVYGIEDISRNLKNGDRALAFYDSERNKYWALPIYKFNVKFCTFELTEDMDSQSAAAKVLTGWGFEPPATDDVIEVTDPIDGFHRALDTARGIAVYTGSDWIIIQCESQAGFVSVELDSDIMGSTASATMIDYWGTQQDVQEPPSSVTVHDPQGLFPNALTGGKGYGSLDVKNNRYVLLNVQQMAFMISGTLSADLDELDASFTESSVNAMSPSPFNLAPVGTQTIYNVFGMVADSGAYFIAVWNSDASQWELIQVRCPPP